MPPLTLSIKSKFLITTLKAFQDLGPLTQPPCWLLLTQGRISSKTDLLPICWSCQVVSCLRVFEHALPSLGLEDSYMSLLHILQLSAWVLLTPRLWEASFFLYSHDIFSSLIIKYWNGPFIHLHSSLDYKLCNGLVCIYSTRNCNSNA